MDWSPTDTDANHIKTSLPGKALHDGCQHALTQRPLLVTPSSDIASRYRRSDSISSENSLTSQSTITQYAKYGLTPVTYPSESSSTSSRSLSRQSNYSTASSNTTSGIPHPRTNSSSNNNHSNASGGGIPTPSRSYTLSRDSNAAKSNASYILSPSSKKGSTQRTAPQLAKRASHIPAPASYTASSPSPQRTISSSSSGLRMPTTPTATQKRIPQRSSHIPSVRESLHRPGSPLQQQHHHHQHPQQPHQRPSATPSRIGMRSPTPGGPRNSVFAAPNKEQQQKRSITPTTRHHHQSAAAEDKRPASAMAGRPSGLRPPGSITAASSTNSVRSVSRIGTYKKPTSS